MIAMRLSEACRPVDGALVGRDVAFSGVSTDTRSAGAAELFIALRGARFDAHDFLEHAERAGAVAAMVEREIVTALPCIKVSDTRAALGRLAAFWRAGFALPVVAVTGSNGKTTVKEMLAAILARHGAVLATRGNLNNDIGVPLTLLRLGAEHTCAVIEMGANHTGEIAYLCRLARPTIAVITLCALAHLEGFGSLERVAHAKGEVVSGLSADGTAVLNADDTYFGLWRELAGNRRVIAFGLRNAADVSARVQGSDDSACNVFEIVTREGAVLVNLPLPGPHNVMNALAAAACALAVGADLEAIRAGLESMRAVHGRLELSRGERGCRLIDDTYNANPSSFEAALTVLARYPGRRWLVLGDMAELGGEAPALHREAGARARALGVERLYGIGALTRDAAKAFGSGGRHYNDIAALIAALREDLDTDVTVLIKGSRAMQMERVVLAIGAG
ncbi:MAG: UDP-N-acetylmuramoyl-tripeptide--D-alanyl-D-alanine ligase [Chromatiales bacterium]